MNEQIAEFVADLLNQACTTPYRAAAILVRNRDKAPDDIQEFFDALLLALDVQCFVMQQDHPNKIRGCFDEIQQFYASTQQQIEEIENHGSCGYLTDNTKYLTFPIPESLLAFLDTAGFGNPAGSVSSIIMHELELIAMEMKQDCNHEIYSMYRHHIETPFSSGSIYHEDQ